MSIDQLLTGLVYLLAVLVLLFIGKLVYDVLHRGFSLREELLERDNLALAITVGGYYLGLVIAIGGVLVGPSEGLLIDLLDLGVFGLLAIALLNLSAWINDKVILRRFDNQKEIITDKNAGTGAIEAGNHIAVGLITAGALSGFGDLVTAGAFWLLGQVAIIIAGLAYGAILPFDVHAEVERDNVAVGVAFAGVLVGFGNVIRFGIEGDFVSWQENLTRFGLFTLVGLVLLPFVRFVVDRMLLSGASLTDELVHQEKPNIGAGAIEGISYLAASMLIGWAI